MRSVGAKAGSQAWVVSLSGVMSLCADCPEMSSFVNVQPCFHDPRFGNMALRVDP